ncbi:MAG: anti-sigma factor antagonist, partial [Candidatus Eisenbacteria bacterium]|nr:anti-sigma factor antagonist [Candidatus Latescibacterota bacterium]MBD3301761.1 anti-sigma factor antagonist [Candidatus Eisenbacteria bacterium]
PSRPRRHAGVRGSDVRGRAAFPLAPRAAGSSRLVGAPPPLEPPGAACLSSEFQAPSRPAQVGVRNPVAAGARGSAAGIDRRGPGGRMRFSQEREGGVLILRLEGQLMGGGEAEEVRDLLLSSIDQGTSRILLDMGEVSWVNSSGLGILIAGHLAARQRGGTMKLMNVGSRIDSILNVTRLSTIFEVYETEEEARRSLQGSNA